MKLKEIKKAVLDGKTVHWSNSNYQVIEDSVGQWLIHSRFNEDYIGLTWQDEVTLNGREDQFYIAKNRGGSPSLIGGGAKVDELEAVADNHDWAYNMTLVVQGTRRSGVPNDGVNATKHLSLDKKQFEQLKKILSDKEEAK